MKPSHQSHLQQFLQLMNSTNSQMQTTSQLLDSLRLHHSSTIQQQPRHSISQQPSTANNNGATTTHILSDEQRKYIVQPSYVKNGINSLVYSQFRQIRLDPEH